MQGGCTHLDYGVDAPCWPWPNKGFDAVSLKESTKSALLALVLTMRRLLAEMVGIKSNPPLCLNIIHLLFEMLGRGLKSC